MPFLNHTDRQRLEDAIKAAELETSGEVVVCLRKRVKGDVRQAAESFFVERGLNRTAQRNAVLIFLATADRQLAVLGDEGIHARVSPDFWENVVGAMASRFKEGDTIGGLEAGIGEIGQQLRKWFPYQEDDVNELPDDIDAKE